MVARKEMPGATYLRLDGSVPVANRISIVNRSVATCLPSTFKEAWIQAVNCYSLHFNALYLVPLFSHLVNFNLLGFGSW